MRRILLLAALLCLPMQLFAADKYVSASGSGTTCSFGSPGKLQTAMAGLCSGWAAGDTFWARAGTYTNSLGDQWIISINCTEAAPCTFRNYNNEHVIIDCKADLTGSGNVGACIATNNASGRYTRMWGFDVQNSSTQQRIVVPGQPEKSPVEQHECQIGAKGVSWINNFFRDGVDGILMTAGPYGAPQDWGTAKTVYGNFFQYSGFVGQQRGYGHSMYLQNGKIDGEAGRSTVKHNVGLRAFDYGIQEYTTGSQISYITLDTNVEAASGHDCCVGAWPTVGTKNTLYLGAGGAIAGCADGCSDKVLFNSITTGNVLYGAGGVSLGGSKGSYTTTITNNYFATLGSLDMTCTTGLGTWTPLTITGNTFQVAPSNTGCPALPFTAANYPSNTFLSSPPAVNPPFVYAPNAYETGRGWVAVYNPQGLANVTVDLAAMGGYPGEQYLIFNWQDNNPWTSTPIATGTCGTPCSTLSLSTTTSSIYQPGFTTDGATPFPKPPDLGPTMVVYYIYPNWGTATTPTPTVTRTPTSTATRTPTVTPTPTGAPTLTPTATFTNLPTNTATFTPPPTPTVTPTPAFPLPSFSVASCSVSAPATKTADATAFGGTYASSPTANNGMLVCPFTWPSTGTGYVWAFVRSHDAVSDSMFIDLDGDGLPSSTCTTNGNNTCTDIFDTRETIQNCSGSTTTCELDKLANDTWGWIRLNDRSATCGICTGVGTQRLFTNLASGNHTLTFRFREATGGESARISWVIVSSDLNYDPGSLVSQTPTPTPGVTSHSHRCNGKIGWHSHPNSGPHRHVPCPWK